METVRSMIEKYPISDLSIKKSWLAIDFDTDLEKKITSEFNKNNFILTESIDDDLFDFVVKLNNNPNIMTDNSCQGGDAPHSNASGYISFTLNKKGWDIFWTKTAPKLLMMPGVAVDTKNWIDGLCSICIRNYIISNTELETRNLKWQYIFKIFNETFLTI